MPIAEIEFSDRAAHVVRATPSDVSKNQGSYSESHPTVDRLRTEEWAEENEH